MAAYDEALEECTALMVATSKRSGLAAGALQLVSWVMFGTLLRYASWLTSTGDFRTHELIRPLMVMIGLFDALVVTVWTSIPNFDESVQSAHGILQTVRMKSPCCLASQTVN